MKILITGATGLVGGALLRELPAAGHEARAAVREQSRKPASAAEEVVVGPIGPDTDWRAALAGVDAVVHAAACVHGQGRFKEADYLRVNVDGTMGLARQAAAAGVRRLIFISTIKVNGEFSLPGRPFTADDPPAPAGPYAQSKQAAEAGLRRWAGESGLEVVIVRPPLIYGPGVKANFHAMLCWLHRGVPLPFGAIHGRRSFLALDNMVDLLRVCLDHPAAAGRILLAADGEDISTAALLRCLGEAMGKRPRLLPIPPFMLKAGMGLCGLGETARRLCADLQVDIEPTRALLGWQPVVGLHTALHQTVRHFLQSR